jgi:large subunit ribosomal protein L15
MKLHQLKPAQGAVKKEKRIGRGEASGKGGTSTKGNKGGQSRAGYKSKLGHEGGQMPIQRRLPKRGFKNAHRVSYKVFNLGQIEQVAEKYNITEISPENLYMNGLISRTDLVKILGSGEIKNKLTFKAIEAAGGSVDIIS